MADDQDMGGLVPFTEDGGRLIRRQWHEDRWYFSVVDVVGLLTDAHIPRNYWSDLKRRLSQEEGFIELHARIVQLKMRSLDGKLRATDAADVETLLRIIQSIPSPKAEPVKQWLAGVGAERVQEAADLAALSEDQRRIFNRDRMTEYNKSLAAAANDAGVLTARDFAVFQDHGYMGLYDGERMRDIHARKGLAKGQHILDHMGSEELASNIFRAAQTEAKLRREDTQGKDMANQTHFEVGRKVRGYIADLGGTMPEELPTPTESIHQIRAREWRRQIGAEQPGLFGADDEGEQDEQKEWREVCRSASRGDECYCAIPGLPGLAMAAVVCYPAHRAVLHCRARVAPWARSSSRIVAKTLRTWLDASMISWVTSSSVTTSLWMWTTSHSG